MRVIRVESNSLEIRDNVEVFFEKRVTPFGNGAKIDCPKRYLDKRAIVIIRERDGKAGLK